MSRSYKPSQIELSETFATIHLNNGGTALVDLADVALVQPWGWRVHPNGNGNSYASAKIDGKIVFLHRLIMATPKSLVVDHIDGNGLDCRRHNMRNCTGAENMRNSQSRRAQFKGVYKHDLRNLWYAKLRTKKLGYFKTAVEAAHAYDEAARTAYGSFARTNF